MDTPNPLEDLGVRKLGLVYVSDSDAGIRRVRAGLGFSYRDAEGQVVRCRQTLARVRAIVIPPAWTDVWICGDEKGHLQATGRDARGRKQYRYHAEWSRIRNEAKFFRMREFGEQLVALRAAIDEELRKPALSREKIVALALAILDRTHIRVGNEEYLRSNGTFGLTTLQDRHAVIDGSKLNLSFIAKGGKRHHVQVQDRRLARLVRQSRELPGQTLFQYQDAEGAAVPIGSRDINEFLLRLTGTHFTAKDFRTWAGTVHAVAFLWDAGPLESVREREKKVVECAKYVSGALNNTVATCRKYYIHPAVFEEYAAGRLHDIIRRRRTRLAWKGLQQAEKSVLKLLVAARGQAIAPEYRGRSRLCRATS